MDRDCILLGIVTKNRAEMLPRAIRSAQAQNVPRLQIAVIDDASTDSTTNLSTEFAVVQWKYRTFSLGYMSARNEMMSVTDCKYFVSLDDDAWFISGDEILVAADYLDQNPDVAAVAFDILSPDRPDPVPREFARQIAVFIGCGHVLRLSAARAVGLYESAPGTYGGEEKDLCIRLMDAGYRIVQLPGVHVWHDKTAVARKIPEQHRSGVCNDLVMTLRRTPATLLLVALLAKFYRHLRFSWRNGLTGPCLQGFRLFLRSVPEVWRTRKPVRLETLRAYLRLAKSSQ